MRWLLLLCRLCSPVSWIPDGGLADGVTCAAPHTAAQPPAPRQNREPSANPRFLSRRRGTARWGGTVRACKSTMFRRKLQALGYPTWQTVELCGSGPEGQAEVHALVVWLEDRKIRALRKEDRAPLRTLGASDARPPRTCTAPLAPWPGLSAARVRVCADERWAHSLREYLSQCQCPHEFSSLDDIPQRRMILEWLLGEAVGLEYADGAAKYNKEADAKAQVPALRGIDYGSAEVQALVESLAAPLQLPAGGETASTLRAVARRIEEKLAPAAIDAFNAGNAGLLQNDTGLEKFAMDFRTGDTAVDQGTKVLRLLYIEDLRRLQTALNNVIVRAQEFTANPKTDARLGKVGR
jgi:RLL motif-containing protein 1